MHPNPIFQTETHDQDVTFARTRGFGVLAVNADPAPLVASIPFLLDESGTFAELHLVRSNPITRMLKKPLAARLVVSGPDGYVSPDWYGIADQVPTWNYISVELTGTLTLRPQDELLDLLNRQSALFEERLLPKPPWTTGKMDPEAMSRMLRMIVPCRFDVSGIQATWKLNQNKPDDVRLAAADQMESSGIGHETQTLARQMRQGGPTN